jgi:hypothetical protein
VAATRNPWTAWLTFWRKKDNWRKEQSDLNIRVSKVVADHNDLLTQSRYI